MKIFGSIFCALILISCKADIDEVGSSALQSKDLVSLQKKYSAICRAGGMSAGGKPEVVKKECSGIVSIGEAWCRAGVLASARRNAARFCKDLGSEAEGICRGGVFSNVDNKQASANLACDDLKL